MASLWVADHPVLWPDSRPIQEVRKLTASVLGGLVGGGNSRSRDARRQACANLLEFAAETSLPLGVSHVPIPGDVQAIAPHHLTSDLASFSDVSAANPRGVTSGPLHQQLPLRLQSPLHYTQRLRKRNVRSGESAKMTIGGCKQKQERMRSLTCK